MRTIVLVLLCGIAAPLIVLAQPARDRARTYLTVRIADRLQLTDEKALAVSALIRQSDERRQRLVAEQRAIEDQMRAALARGHSATDDLANLVAAGTEINRKLALIPEEMFHEAQKILTVEQQARLLLFRRDFQHEVRHAMHKRLRGRDPAPLTHSAPHVTPTPN